MASETEAWVTVSVGDGCYADCRLEPRRRRPAIVEVRVRAEDGDEINVSLLRRLKKSEVVEEFAAQYMEDEKSPTSTRRDHYEDLLALVAIAHEKFVSSRHPHPSRAVWELLSELHDASPETVRTYTRSGVRGLIRRAKEAGYDEFARKSATETLRFAQDRGASLDPGHLEDLASWADE